MHSSALVQAATRASHSHQRLLPLARQHVEDYEVFTNLQSALTEVAVLGSPDIDQLISTLHVVGLELEDTPGTRMVLDLRAIRSHFSNRELARVGEEIALSFAHLEKVALVVMAHRITRISERAAQRNGLNLRVFSGMASAHDWIGVTRQ